MWLLSNLPDDIIHHILSYDTVLKYRNGKYMNQIAKSDPRNALITQRVLYPRNRIYHTVTNRQDDVILFYRPYDIYWSITVRQEKVLYRYSFNLDSKDSDTTFHLWIID